MSVAKLRREFLRAVDRQVPRVFEELTDIAVAIPRVDEREFDQLLWSDGRYAQWAERWGFVDSWLQYIIARNTAYEIWMGRRRGWLCGQALLIPPEIPVAIAPWRYGESDAVFLKRADETLRAYVKARRHQLIRSGLEVPRKRAMRQFDHLALVHVKQLSYKQVADLEALRYDHGADDNTIMKGVVNTADQIGLTLRTPPVGRPRKKKSGSDKA